MTHTLDKTAVTQPQPKRRRTSEAAIRDTLKAIHEAGLSVEKVCVAGGQVEIHCGQIETRRTDEEDGGLKDW